MTLTAHLATPVIQKEPSGCGIAACAALAGLTYEAARARAAALGIHASDRSLWSNTACVRTLLVDLGIETSREEYPFTGWDALPDRPCWRSGGERSKAPLLAPGGVRSRSGRGRGAGLKGRA